MNKIILVNPFFDSHIFTPPLGLGYLSSNIRKSHSDVDISIIDCLSENINNMSLIKIIAEKRPDLIGLTIYSMVYRNVKEIIERIKKLNSNIRVVIGGPHVSALPIFSLEDTKADFAIFGEGEETFVEFLSKIRNRDTDFSALNGLCYRDSNCKVVKNQPRELVRDLSHIIWPDWQLIDPNKYPPAPHGGIYKRFPIAPIITTRGCPFECKFCGTRLTWKGVIRYRNKDDVVNEIEHLVTKFGVREFHFEDDNFTFLKEHAFAICKEIVRRNLDIVWACPNGVRIDTLDDELLKIMKKSGCYLLAFGIESGSQEILNGMGKHLDRTIVYDVLKKVKNIGIETWGFFIIGLPGENKKTIRETVNFAKKLPLDRAQFCNFTPIPGTSLFDLWLKQRNISNLSEVNWDSFNFYGKCIFDTDELDTKELTKLQKKAFLSFYCRLKIFLNIILKIKFKQLKFILKRLKVYLLK